MKRNIAQRYLLVFGIPLLTLFAVFQMASGTTRSIGRSESYQDAKFTQSLQKPLLNRFSLNVARRNHTATALIDGKVVIIGGENENGPVSEAEILDTASQALSIVARLENPRFNHTTTLLPDGRVLVIGGSDQNSLLASTEIFHPETNSFTSGPSLHRARSGHSATVLDDGRILIAGGRSDGSAEIFNTATGSFTLLKATLAVPRSLHGAVLLKDGNILFAGGVGHNDEALETAEIFDTKNPSFTLLDHWMRTKRVRPTLRLLPDGKVQVIGGDRKGTMEVYSAEWKIFRGYAPLIITTDSIPVSNILGAQTRTAYINNRTLLGNRQTQPFSNIAERDHGVYADLLDRIECTSTEIPNLNQAVIAGGVSKEGKLVNSVILLKSSPTTLTTDMILYHPGESPAIRGNGWEPNERVLITRQNTKTGKRSTLQSFADNQGEFINTDLMPTDYEAGTNYILTAVGQSSGYTVQTVYRDSSPTRPELLPFNQLPIVPSAPSNKSGDIKMGEKSLKLSTSSAPSFSFGPPAISINH